MEEEEEMEEKKDAESLSLQSHTSFLVDLLSSAYN